MKFMPRCSAALLAACALGAGTGRASAATIWTLAISGATFSNGSDLSGSISYEYNTANDLTQVVSADLAVTAGTNVPAYTLIYNVPGESNTAAAPGWDYNNPADQNYEFVVTQAAGGSITLFLDMAGIGPSGEYELYVSGGNFSALDNDNASDVYRLTNAGTSTDLQVPEPAGLTLLLAGVLGIGLARQRGIHRRAAIV